MRRCRQVEGAFGGERRHVSKLYVRRSIDLFAAFGADAPGEPLRL